MASLLVKRAASSLLRVRSVTSSLRLYTTKVFQYDQYDSKDECILKCDDRYGSVVRDIVKDVFSPRRSPIGNLACLLNVADDRIGFTYEPRMLSRWRAVEDDKALYLIRDMTLVDDESENESVPNKECISEIHEKDFDESVTKELVPKRVTVRDRDLVPIVDLMRGNETAPCEYYYHVMRDFEEISQFLESIEGGLQTPIKGKKIDLSICRLVSFNLKNPQAVYIIIALGGSDTDNPFGGYAIEIFLPDKFYKLEDLKVEQTSELLWEITIPKKKGKSAQTIAGNLLFFQERKIWKPTLWRPT